MNLLAHNALKIGCTRNGTVIELNSCFDSDQHVQSVVEKLFTLHRVGDYFSL
jgi:hypothetical protein